MSVPGARVPDLESDRTPSASIPESKKARKRRLRHELYLARRAERRTAAKQRRRQRRQLETSQTLAGLDTTGERQSGETHVTDASTRGLERLIRDYLQCTHSQQISRRFHCIVDLGASALLTSKELRKSIIQLRQMYVVNRRLVREALLRKQEHICTFQVTICGLDTRALDIRSQVFGEEALRWPSITWTSSDLASYLAETAGAIDAVVLTADATQTLMQVEPNTLYILGGIVDRNRLKGLMLERAQTLGLPARRLPLELLPSWRGSPVLTTCHAFEALARVAAGQSWSQALNEVLPQRKRSPAASRAEVACLNATGSQVNCERSTSPDSLPDGNDSVQSTRTREQAVVSGGTSWTLDPSDTSAA
ncbi:hypothetical protein, conserved [Cyanidioschyzon merolae strain 10D]|jgi:tRNA (guanine9-N1)-methyltransferase|uniref:tRNA (guanine(9)-N(1))-methyltransferase n=1 Tax=Cyanidioschyzon merolae (strain NIES-3377 / 10D) TaxID=280699 RepID=M1V5S9_CYAM1|nr:hypothetical protein, conserved [Cyanidioschyzon merolae strain 10D]BAM81200.1 hypothetical protein, conserved [Cyanidioschyzon merolae strain 10D]|eukprot:XP_005537236.1 hypothetical protein, conserved [Cyanidioschyzon merolae strain 10D]